MHLPPWDDKERRKMLEDLAWLVILLGILLAIAVALSGCGPTPAGIPSKNGIYSVGVEADYGTYTSTLRTCRWEIAGDHPRHGAGISTVTLNDYDATITVTNCGAWIEVKSR